MRKKDFKTRNPKLAFEQYRMLEALYLERKVNPVLINTLMVQMKTQKVHGLKFATVEDAKMIEKSGKTHKRYRKNVLKGKTEKMYIVHT